MIEIIHSIHTEKNPYKGEVGIFGTIYCIDRDKFFRYDMILDKWSGLVPSYITNNNIESFEIYDIHEYRSLEDMYQDCLKNEADLVYGGTTIKNKIDNNFQIYKRDNIINNILK